MPPGEYSGSELTALVAYVRTMRDLDASNIRVGDAGRGQSIVMGEGDCTSCHRIEGEGSLGMAPDLSLIGASRSAGSLESSLLSPSASMIPINRPVRAVLSDGTVVNGRRVNEDTYSVQLIDETGRLRSLDKTTLRDFTILKTSPMPSFEDTLTTQEIGDVLAYLLTLQGPGRTGLMTAIARTLTLVTVALALVAPGAAQAQGPGVTFERILNAESEPENWLTYSGGYGSNRHTLLDQIDATNAEDLELKWVFQAQSLQVFQTSPLVVDGIMYLTEAPSTVVALDAKLGRVFWRYEYTPSTASRPCCRLGQSRSGHSREHALHGDTRRQADSARCHDGSADLGD